MPELENQLSIKTLNMQEMWDVFSRWRKQDILPRDLQFIYRILYSNEDVTKYDPGTVIQMIIYGLNSNGLTHFSTFIGNITNGGR